MLYILSLFLKEFLLLNNRDFENNHSEGVRKEAKHGIILDRCALAKSWIHGALTAKGAITI